MFVPESPVGLHDPTPQQPRDPELVEISLEVLEHEICQLASDMTAGMARWLALVGEFDRRDGWNDWSGCRSTVGWISWRCALSPRAAREHVRVARALTGLPGIRAMFESGRLSYSKVRVLTRAAEPDSESDLLELAEHATASQLERMLRAFRRVTRAEAQAAHENRYLTWHWDEDGSLCLRARLPAEEGALVLASPEESHAALVRNRDDSVCGPAGPPHGNGPAGPADPDRLREHPLPTRADALCSMAETALARGPTPRAGPDRHHLIVDVDLDLLSRDGEGVVHVRDGPALAPEAARRLGCDASLVSIASAGGEALSVGRRTRSIPPHIRRALEARDKGCRFPGCENRRWVDGHHIEHWAKGGETSLDNLVLLCRHHHRLLHEGGYSVKRRAADGRLDFRRPDGHAIPVSPRLPPAGEPPAAVTVRGPLMAGTGETMDLASCVDAVFAATRHG
ncbi:MAG: DUF222 domain-containing protein [Solirubrobacterales bacterium]